MSRPDRLGDAAGDLATRLAAGRTPPLVPRPARRRGARRRRRARRRCGRRARRRRGALLRLLRAHLDDRLVPSPFHLPRIDRHGLPVRPRDGKPVDNLGRPIDRHGMPVDRAGHRLLGPDGSAAAARAAHADLPGLGAGDVRRRRAPAGLLVPLLRRPDPQALGLLLAQHDAHQRRRGALGLLLRRSPRLLRHLPRHGHPVLTVVVLAAAGLIAGVSGAWSP